MHFLFDDYFLNILCFLGHSTRIIIRTKTIWDVHTFQGKDGDCIGRVLYLLSYHIVANWTTKESESKRTSRRVSYAADAGDVDGWRTFQGDFSRSRAYPPMLLLLLLLPCAPANSCKNMTKKKINSLFRRAPA